MKSPLAKTSRGALFYTLFFACLSVWGYVLYQVAHGLGQMDDAAGWAPLVTPSPRIDTVIPSARHRAHTPYEGDFRDPFQLPGGVLERRSRPPRPLAEPAPPDPPPLVLTGVVDETALLRGRDGSVYVVRVGERAAGVRVLKVYRDHVVVRFEGRSHPLALTR